MSGCDSVITLTLTVKPVLQATLNQEICEGSAYFFTSKYPDLATAGTYKDTLTSMSGCDSIVMLQLAVTEAPDTTKILANICLGSTYREHGFNLTPTRAGLVTECLSISRGSGCDSTVMLLLTVIKVPDTIRLFDKICLGNTYTNHGFNITPLSAGIITEYLYLMALSGCDSVVCMVLHVPEVKVEIVPSTFDFCDDHHLTLTAVSPQTEFRWNTGEQESVITVSNSGTYSVTAFAGGCTATDHYTIEPCSDFVVFPNAITPGNGDGLNDYFYLPNTSDVNKLSIFIYDRYGKLVFSSHDKHFQWDGRNQGKLLQGVYSYVAFIILNDGTEKRFTGSVTVL
jgi:gliding motility-associated-like protein